MATADDLLAEAAVLDADATRLPEGAEQARELRREAAELRVEALGPRPYPVLVCSVCFRLTGWVGADGACASDTRRRLEAADASRLGVPDRRDPRPSGSRCSAGSSAGSASGRRATGSGSG